MKERYNSFDGLRAIAAIGILLMHYLANIDEVCMITLQESSILYKEVIPFFTMFVYMFFIISAFSMCCGYLNHFKVIEGKSSFNTEGFYSKRYSRIWPFFALLVLIDLAMKPSMEELYQCIANLTLAFNLLPNPHIDAIGVGWFLGVIFLFYMIFPWFVYLLQKKSRAWFAMAIALMFHVILVQYFLTSQFCTEYQIDHPRHNIVYSFPFIMAGGIIYLYRKELTKSWQKLIWLVIAIFMTIGQICWHPQILGENILYILILYVFWILYAMTGGYNIKGFKFLDNKLMCFLGNISMEIYLCHMVIFRLVEMIQLDSLINNPHLYYWGVCTLGILFSITFSWFVKYKLFGWLGKNFSKLAFLR